MALEKSIWNTFHLYKEIPTNVIIHEDQKGDMFQEYIEWKKQPHKITDVSQCKSILPSQYKWKLSLDNDDIPIITNFLRDNYVEGQAKYLHSYNCDYIGWLLKNKQMVCLRIYKSTNHQIIGLICANIIKLQVYDKQIITAEISLMCVHKKFRKLGISKLLTRGISYFCQINDIRCGIFSTSKVLTTPLVQLCYSIIPINVAKLLKLGIVSTKKKGETKSIIKYYETDYTINENFIYITPRHFKRAYEVFNEYMEKYNIHIILSLEEFIDIYCTNEIIKTFVMLNKDKSDVCDVISYCIRPFSRTAKKETDTCENIMVAQLLFYTSNDTTIYTLYKNIITHIKKQNCDLLLLSNDSETDQLCTGVECITYTNNYCYLINCDCPSLKPTQFSMSTLI